MTDLKLYVWEDVLADYTSGVMFALASSVEEARKLLLESCSHIPADDLNKEPIVRAAPFALAVWGGG